MAYLVWSHRCEGWAGIEISRVCRGLMVKLGDFMRAARQECDKIVAIATDPLA